MFAQEKSATGRRKDWRRDAKRILLFIFSVVSVNAVTVTAARTCAMVRDIGRQNRESREWYKLYHEVMATQNRQQPWTSPEGDPVSGLQITELKDVIRWSEQRLPLGGNR